MARLKYGPLGEGGPKPISLPFAASQYFHELGGALVLADGNGRMIGALTASTSLFGWALLGFSPRDSHVAGTMGSRYFLTSSTAGEKHKVKPLTAADNFWMPADDTFAEATHRGIDCDILGVNDGTVQQADIGTSSTNLLRIIDGSGTDVLVGVNPSKLQVAQA